MSNVILAIICPGILAYLIIVGKSARLHRQKGWGLMLSGFAFVLCGVLISTTDSFLGMDNSLTIGGIEYWSFMSFIAGYFPGFTMLVIGFWKWAHSITSIDEARIALSRSREQLGSQISEHTAKLKNLTAQLELELLERRRTEQTLQETEAKYQSVLDRPSDGVCIIHGDLIEHANPHMKNIIGHDPESMIGNRITPYIHPDEIMTFIEQLGKCTSNQEMTRQFNSVLIHSDNRNMDAEINLTAIPYGKTNACLLVIRDITHRKQIESKLCTSSAKVGQIGL